MEFLLHYQPQVSLVSGQVEAVEALIRWQHRSWDCSAPVSSSRWQNIGGLIVPIGRWVINEAIRRRIWQELGIRAGLPSIFPPCSSSSKVLWMTLRARLREHGVTGECLEIRLTESVHGGCKFGEQDARRFEGPRGVARAVDDFGTGYSPCPILKRYPIDKIRSTDRSSAMSPAIRTM